MKKDFFLLVLSVLLLNVLARQAAAGSLAGGKPAAVRLLTMRLAPSGTMPLDDLPSLIRGIADIGGAHADAAQKMAADLTKGLPTIQTQITALAKDNIHTLAQLETRIAERRAAGARSKELEPLEELLEKASYAAPLHPNDRISLAARFTAQVKRAKKMAEALIGYDASLQSGERAPDDAELVEAAQRAALIATTHLHYIPAPAQESERDLRKEAFAAYFRLWERERTARERTAIVKAAEILLTSPHTPDMPTLGRHAMDEGERNKPQAGNLPDFGNFDELQRALYGSQPRPLSDQQIKRIVSDTLRILRVQSTLHLGVNLPVGAVVQNDYGTGSSSTIEHLIPKRGFITFKVAGETLRFHTGVLNATPVMVFNADGLLRYEAAAPNDPGRILRMEINHGRQPLTVTLHAVKRSSSDSQENTLWTIRLEGAPVE